METELLHIGFGGVIAANRILAVAGPDAAPIRRLIRQAKEKGLAIDMTHGRKAKAAIFLDSGHIALVALQPETIVGRLKQQREQLSLEVQPGEVCKARGQRVPEGQVIVDEKQSSGLQEEYKLDVSRFLEPPPLLIVLSGPSGVGKDATVIRMKELGYPFHFVVTATDRPQRPGEVHGVDYYFVSSEEFADMLERDELLEHAVVYGQHKGIPRSHVRQALASGKDVIMRLDVQGATTVRRIVPDALLIFLMAPSEEDLLRRLKERKTESPEDLEKRVALAHEEMKRLPEFDYVVVNRDGKLDETVEQIMAIVTAEKCRVKQRKIEL